MQGGVPRRITFEGGCALVKSWTPDNRIIYSSPRYSLLPAVQLLAVKPTGFDEGGLIPLSEASDGTMLQDEGGDTLFFTRLPKQTSWTKRYKGGSVEQLWKFKMPCAVTESEEAIPLSADFTGTSSHPMLLPQHALKQEEVGRDGSPSEPGVYLAFRSDRDDSGTMNLYMMDALTGQDVQQLTFHTEFDVLAPSVCSLTGRIVYQHGADLWCWSPTRLEGNAAVGAIVGTYIKLTFSLVTDCDQLRTQIVPNPASFLSALHPSPSGDRVVATARGSIFVFPVKEGRGRTLELTATSSPANRHTSALGTGASPANRHTSALGTAVGALGGVRYRDARFVPGCDNELVAFSDASGEVEVVHIRMPPDATGADSNTAGDHQAIGGFGQQWQEHQITRGSKVLPCAGGEREWSHRTGIMCSPNGRHLAYCDRDYRLWLVLDFRGIINQLPCAQRILAATGPCTGICELTWAPDSCWIAYTSTGIPIDYLGANLYPLLSAHLHFSRIQHHAPHLSAPGVGCRKGCRSL
jgi:tricorn protease